MTTQAEYKNRSASATLRQKNVQTQRTKEKDANKAAAKLAGAKDTATNLYNEWRALDNQVKELEKDIAAEIQAGSPGSVITDLRVQKEATVKKRDAKYSQYTVAQNAVKELQNKNNFSVSKKLVKPVDSSKNPSGTVVKKEKKATISYKYNAPMVRNAYFNPTSISAKSIDENNLTINYSSYTDANSAWKNTRPAKGAIQMDREFTKAQIDNFDKSNKQVKLDLQMYGFKFLYNPKEVSMGWSTQGYIDPSFMSQDEAIPISTALTASTINVSLVLNRIEDMNYIDTNGLISKQKNKTKNQSRDTTTTTRDSHYAANLVDRTPYPEAVASSDLQEIYNKGTMYDLEYLFRTINGPNAVFKNFFGIDTADRSYMKLSIVELHLGNSMRYRGRISDLEVNHTIFNNRMIPILSTVRISFARINDAFVAPDTGAKK